MRSVSTADLAQQQEHYEECSRNVTDDVRDSKAAVTVAERKAQAVRQ